VLYCGSEILVERISILRRNERHARCAAGQSNEDMGMDCTAVLVGTIRGCSSAYDLGRMLQEIKRCRGNQHRSTFKGVVTLLSA